ncbi:OmpA family protein [Candidatus Poribacteria bacterium]|nr:OmpA family protein [Candidatus Poribacteria bacterium]
MKKKEPEPEETASAPLWCLSYGDLMTNLFVFFILIVAFSGGDKNNEKLNQAIASINDSFGFGVFDPANKKMIPPIIDPKMISGPENQKAKIAELTEQVRALIKKNNTVYFVNIIQYKEGVKFRIRSEILFEDDSDILKSSAIPFLGELTSSLAKLDNDINIESHTSNEPVDSKRFKNNWDLSMARASKLIEFIISKDKIKVHKLSVACFGSVKPLLPNDTNFQRRLNNRIELDIKYKN